MLRVHHNRRSAYGSGAHTHPEAFRQPSTGHPLRPDQFASHQASDRVVDFLVEGDAQRLNRLRSLRAIQIVTVAPMTAPSATATLSCVGTRCGRPLGSGVATGRPDPTRSSSELESMVSVAWAEVAVSGGCDEGPRSASSDVGADRSAGLWRSLRGS